MNTYTVSSVADEFGVSEQTVRNWIKSGKLKAEKTGPYGSYIITEGDLDDFCEEMELYEQDEEDEEPEAPTNEELIVKSVDKMIERYEHELKVIEVKLDLLYTVRDKFESL